MLHRIIVPTVCHADDAVNGERRAVELIEQRAPRPPGSLRNGCALSRQRSFALSALSSATRDSMQSSIRYTPRGCWG